LAPWCKQCAIHDLGKVAADLAVTLAAGGDCPADLAVLHGQQELFGPVASDPTVSRLVAALAEGVSRPWRGAGRPRERTPAELGPSRFVITGKRSRSGRGPR